MACSVYDMGITGYARVSTLEQNEDAQVSLLREAGADVIYIDHASGKDMERPEWRACLKSLHRGDVLLVTRIDRLGRSLIDLVETIQELGRRGIEFRSLSEAIDTTSPGGQLLFSITAAFAEYERSLIRARTLEGLDAARERGVKLGRPAALTGEQKELVAVLRVQGKTLAEIARLLNVSRSTVYRVLKE